MRTSWKTYEEVATYLLQRNAKAFGLEMIEPKQKIQGNRSDTTWEIDAKGIKSGSEGFVIIECRQYTASKQNQEKLGGLAYRIMDTGAAGGIIVSPLGLQEGANKIADSENIINVQLDANCTPTDFVLKFLNKVMIGLSEKVTFSEVVLVVHKRICRTCGQQFTVKENENICPNCSK